MIESIEIAGVATYGEAPEKMQGLSKFNFIYGSNGSGKTTVSRVVADETGFASCRVNWKAGTKMQAMVYNRDFVEKNFGPSAELKGIFTLGEEDADSAAKVIKAKEDIDALTKKIEGLNATLLGATDSIGKRNELADLEEKFKESCWAQKRKHDSKFATAFEGHRNSAESFKGKVLQQRSTNTASLVDLSLLEEKAKTVFGPTPTAEPLVSLIDAKSLLEHGANPILKRRVLGKEDVDITAMIQRLGNSDWVRQGRPYLEANDSICPFCQQETNESFACSLNDYFDESFTADSKKIDDLCEAYGLDAERVEQRITAITGNPSRFLDLELFKAEISLLESRNTVNKQRLAQKRREPSQMVELEPLDGVIKKISELIDTANASARSHNLIVSNLATERRSLSMQVWRYILDAEIQKDISDYESEKDSLEKAITAISGRINTAETDKRAKLIELSTLEKASTSIQPTIDAINGLLASFGFRGFSLAKSAAGSSYRLSRQNGTDAKQSLSEGEKTFITFLYFYHLLRGSNSETGITTNRIVVFDDPVSSLDSDILFIVGSLIKGLFDEVRGGSTNIKQIFVLTHNVYFHKEVTFNKNRSRDGRATSEETFWVVRKAGLLSSLEKHEANPVTTSYDLLWSELRTPNRSNLTIQNVLRRILENYFKILGGMDFETICLKFEGQDRLTCRSLFSWVNDGSHFTHDDLYVAIDDTMVERYLSVFKVVFVVSGHEAHYKMMMGELVELA